MKTKKPIQSHIPDIEIIDLEQEIPSDTNNETPSHNKRETTTHHKSEAPEKTTSKKGIRSFLNMHMLLLVVFIIFVTCIFIKFSNWGEEIDISQIESDNSDVNLDIMDQFLPLIDSEGKVVDMGEIDTIVTFGNAPFADDRNSEDNLANMIAKATGATVYNCSVTDSYLASQWPFFDANEKPMDAYCFYWLVTLAANGANAHYYEDAARVLGDDIPPDAQQVYDMLTTIDFNEVDVVTVMYDASDYLMGHEMYDDTNPTNIQQFTGNLEAGIELLQYTYPHIRIIVLSPTYAYAIDGNGEYVSSDMYRYGQDVLSTYVIKQFGSCASRSVSFVDNLYGTITEDNAREYLTDHIHLNVEGRKLVTQRFMDALNRKK